MKRKTSSQNPDTKEEFKNIMEPFWFQNSLWNHYSFKALDKSLATYMSQKPGITVFKPLFLPFSYIRMFAGVTTTTKVRLSDNISDVSQTWVEIEQYCRVSLPNIKQITDVCLTKSGWGTTDIRLDPSELSRPALSEWHPGMTGGEIISQWSEELNGIYEEDFGDIYTVELMSAFLSKGRHND